MKIKWGALVVDGRGKIGGHVASKNRSGAYLRTKVTPVNPQTSFQTAVRTLFASISQQWSALSVAVRDGWEGAVSQWTDTDVFGDIKTPSGKTLHMRLNNQAIQAGYAAIPGAPPKAEVPIDNITQVDIAVGGDVTITGATVDPSVRYMVFATPQLSQGTSFVKNQLRLINDFDAAVADPIALGQAYIAKFGAAVTGSNVHFGFKKVLDNGQASPLQVLKAIVA